MCDAEARASGLYIEFRGFRRFGRSVTHYPPAMALRGLVVLIHCLRGLRGLSFIVLYFIPFFRHFLLLSASSSSSMLILNVFAHAFSSFF